jgi:hypothetical protein
MLQSADHRRPPVGWDGEMRTLTYIWTCRNASKPYKSRHALPGERTNERLDREPFHCQQFSKQSLLHSTNPTQSIDQST